MASIAFCSTLALLRHAQAGPLKEGDDIALVLPKPLSCYRSSGRQQDGEDILAAIQRLSSWAVKSGDSVQGVHAGFEESSGHETCVMSQLAAFARGHGGTEGDELLLALARSPGGLLLADLGRMARWPHDFALDPWYRHYCRQRYHHCIGNGFDEAVSSEETGWLELASSMYVQLQPLQLSMFSSDAIVSVSPQQLVSVVGTHSGLSLAASAALVDAAREVQADVQLDYFGHWAWCQNVNNCEEPLALLFRSYQQDWAETDAETNQINFVELIEGFRMFLLGMVSVKLRSADFILCTRPFVFCWLLRELWPQTLTQLPMLHYYSGPLLFDVPAVSKLQVLRAFRSTVLNSPIDLVIASSVLQSAWMLAMAGVAVPHVRPHATNLRGLYFPPIEQPATLRVLVLRSTWVATIMGDVFRTMLATVLKENDLHLRVATEWLMGEKFMQYAEIASFHAAVFFPEQPDKLTFWEQYEMAMPLWLPSADFWVRIHAINEFRDSVFAHKWAAQLKTGLDAAAACGVPKPLFFETSEGVEHVFSYDSPLTAAFWFYLTDYAIFPHLHLFSSASSLVVQLLTADMAADSARMASFNKKTWRASASFYQDAIVALRQQAPAGTAHASTVGLTVAFRAQPSDTIAWCRICGTTQGQASRK